MVTRPGPDQEDLRQLRMEIGEHGQVFARSTVSPAVIRAREVDA